MNAAELMKLKEKIESAKGRISELKGREEYLLEQLREDWKCDSVKAAEAKITKLRKEAEGMATAVEKQKEALLQKLAAIQSRVEGEEA